MAIERDPLFLPAIVPLLFGYLLLGIAHIAILPPWEGFDETAHYSYLQEITDTLKFPQYGFSRMSQEVREYARYAPIPYRSEPPMEQNGGFTYKSFFEGPIELTKRGRDYVHRRPDEPRHYAKGNVHNWQSQHPPLYYLLLSPAYLATRHLSWAAQLFILRLISYLFAWIALIVTVLASLKTMPLCPGTEDTSSRYLAIIGIAAWPVLFPAWFPEMARLGNDSLCALIMSIIWFITVRALNTERSIKYSITLGILLGLGCLTKAFFIPVAFGIVCFWSLRLLSIRKTGALKSVAPHSLLICLIIACVAGWWYLHNWHSYGLWLGSDETVALRDKGGLVVGLSNNFSMKAWLRGHAAFVTTLGWCGTWSWVRPPYVYLVPIALTPVFFGVGYIVAIRRSKMVTTSWLPVWLTVPALLGFSYHVLVRIALTGEGRGTSGYYLHAMVAPLAVALGISLWSMWPRKGLRRIASILFLYAVAFSVAMSWLQVLLFSGILFKAGNSKFYQFPEALPPFLGLSDALDRLKVIAFPNIGVVAWIMGGILVFVGLIFSWKSANRLVVKKGECGISGTD